MVTLSGRDTWIVTFISYTLGLFWVLFFVMKTGEEKLAEIMKKPAGKIVGLVLLFFYIEVALLMIYDFLSFFDMTMPKTPPVTFSIMLVALCAYALIKGFETAARTSEVLAVVIILLIVFGLLSGFNKIRLENTLPVLENGIKPLAKGVVYSFSNIGDLLVLYFMPLNITAGVSRRNVSLVMLIIYVIILSLSISLTGILGEPQAGRVIYKLFEIFRFIPRIETFFIPLWFSVFLIKVSVLFYASVKVIQMVVAARSYKSFILPTGVLLIALTKLSFESYIQWLDFYLNTFAYVAILIQILIPTVLLLMNFKKNDGTI